MNGNRGEHVELTTERLYLRPFQETDHEDLYEFLSQLENDEFEGYGMILTMPEKPGSIDISEVQDEHA